VTVGANYRQLLDLPENLNGMEFLLETAGKAFEGIVDDLLILVVEELCK
jgi:hypothetical protein